MRSDTLNLMFEWNRETCTNFIYSNLYAVDPCLLVVLIYKINTIKHFDRINNGRPISHGGKA